MTGRYLPHSAHRRALERCGRSRPGKLATNAELRAFVQARLDERWSPAQIAESLAATFAEEGRHAGVPGDDLPGAVRPWAR